MLSLDKEYQQKRQVEKHRQKPRNVLEGVGYGLKDFGTGLFTGVTGLIVRFIVSFSFLVMNSFCQERNHI
jgi:hypothetical protein